jgi:uncharacterized protein YodC (DUF2158 family)
MPNENTIEVGDIVNLRSGGPKMTVIEITLSGCICRPVKGSHSPGCTSFKILEVRCMWFNYSQAVCIKSFKPEWLFVFSRPRLEAEQVECIF